MLKSLVVALVASALLPAAVLADGDPASDVLLGENVFYPYSPATSPAIQRQLNAETAAAKQAHFPLKVALIGAPVDLGVIPSLFGQPQKYADFLDQEISFQTKQPLLVVMASGYGVEGMDATAQAAVSALDKPAGTQSNELGQAAITAVGKLAAASGHPLQGTTEGSDGGGTSKAVLVAILAAIAIAAAGSLIFVRRRYATR
jgi:hypothetical protein